MTEIIPLGTSLVVAFPVGGGVSDLAEAAEDAVAPATLRTRVATLNVRRDAMHTSVGHPGPGLEPFGQVLAKQRAPRRSVGLR